MFTNYVKASKIASILYNKILLLWFVKKISKSFPCNGEDSQYGCRKLNFEITQDDMHLKSNRFGA